MKIFTTHMRQGEPPVLLREGFSWGAFVFGFLYLAVHRAWIAASLNLLALVLVGLLCALVRSGAPLLGLAILQGLFAQDLRRWTLSLRGFTPGPVVAGPDQDQAFMRLVGNASLSPPGGPTL